MTPWWQWAAMFIGMAMGMILVARLMFWKISLLLEFRPGTYPVIIKLFGWGGAMALIVALGLVLMGQDDGPLYLIGGVFCLLVAGWCAFFFKRRHPRPDDDSSFPIA